MGLRWENSGFQELHVPKKSFGIIPGFSRYSVLGRYALKKNIGIMMLLFAEKPRTNSDKSTLESLHFLWWKLTKQDWSKLFAKTTQKMSEPITEAATPCTSINKVRSYKLHVPSTTEKVFWIAFKTYGITSKTCAQCICVKETIESLEIFAVVNNSWFMETAKIKWSKI